MGGVLCGMFMFCCGMYGIFGIMFCICGGTFMFICGMYIIWFCICGIFGYIIICGFVGGICGVVGFLNVGMNLVVLVLREKDLASALSLDLDAFAGWATFFVFLFVGFFFVCCVMVFGILFEFYVGVGGVVFFGVGNIEEYRFFSS